MGEGITSYIVDNDKKFRDALSRVSLDIKDLTIPMTLISKDFYRSERAIWNLKSPGQYPDLMPSTKRDRARRGQAVYPILERTGKLKQSMTDPSDPSAINVIGSDKQSLTIGTTVEYGRYHQTGTSRMEMRKFLFIGPEAPRFASGPTAGRLERWVHILEGFYAQKMKAVGGLGHG